MASSAPGRKTQPPELWRVGGCRREAQTTSKGWQYVLAAAATRGISSWREERCCRIAEVPGSTPGFSTKPNVPDVIRAAQRRALRDRGGEVTTAPALEVGKWGWAVAQLG